MKLTIGQFITAIARVESGGNPQAWGDGGRAIGQWQQHPAFVAEWFASSKWTLGMTWDDVCSHAIYRFAAAGQAAGADDVAMAIGYHLHGQPASVTADRNDPYGVRFRAACAALGFPLAEDSA